jgi:hypothetical protein
MYKIYWTAYLSGGKELLVSNVRTEDNFVLVMQTTISRSRITVTQLSRFLKRARQTDETQLNKTHTVPRIVPDGYRDEK